MLSTQAEPTDRMQCMEVWGGNSHVSRGFETPGLGVWLHSRPYQQADRGGDVYYVSSCASGRITRLLLADVSGHGEAAANVAMQLRELMRSHVNLINQARFVREMNQQFPERPGEGDFATALVCTFFAPTRSLQFCNAGHPLPMLYRAHLGNWGFAHEMAHVQRGDGLADTPLGMIEDADYSRFKTKLSPGDMVLCVSDAFNDSFDSTGSMLGSAGLLRIINEIDSSQPDQIIPQLISLVKNERQGNLLQDDATILLFRADGSTPSLANNLLAPFRLLSNVRDSTIIT